MHCGFAGSLAGLVLLLTPALAGAQGPQVIPVAPLAGAPSVDGDLREWGGGWAKIPLKPAVEKGERPKLGLDPEDRNLTGSITVELKAGVAGGRIYIAVRWPDDAADAEFRPWEWKGTRYAEANKRDDMFALRFPLEGEFDRSMLSGKSYRVDVWLWSAGRSNAAGLAEDMVHDISTRMLENAAEYEVQGVGTVYIKKRRDAGRPIYRNLRPPQEKGAERIPSVELTGSAAGSLADVAARGVWKNGYWNLELSRKLDTGHSDDVVLRAGQKINAQIAVFNRAADENKSVSEIFVLDLAAVK
ncbi:MAG: hypothetical protein HYU77_11515 [Betaproteobacteria bacterium]|nr:hypothetical protein [Betaproteobacteria bacterium]